MPKHSDETKQKIAEGVRRRRAEHPLPKKQYTCEKCNEAFFGSIKKGRKARCEECRRKTKAPDVRSLATLPKRTMHKILKRMKACCAICGWQHATCDVHHIVPKSKGGSHSDDNLIVVCPNHHRIIHQAPYKGPTLNTKAVGNGCVMEMMYNGWDYREEVLKAKSVAKIYANWRVFHFGGMQVIKTENGITVHGIMDPNNTDMKSLLESAQGIFAANETQ